MRKIILTLFVLSLFYPAFSQDSLLKKFKYRINHYRVITLQASGNAQFNKTDFPANTLKSNAGAGAFGGTYSFTRSTDRILLNFFGGLSTSFGTAKSEDNTDDNRNKSLYYSAYANVSNKWFKRNFFTELGAEFSTNASVNKSTSKNPVTSYKNNDFNPYASITLGIGKGRLENITDMQNALWLYKALSGENKLARSLSPEELNELGRTITTSNNTRILDSRRRTQFVLETVDSYLQKKGLVSSTDIRYFSSLNDILFFAFNNFRRAGTEKFIRLTPSISHRDRDYNQNSGTTRNETKNTTKAINLSVGINHHRPVNLKHQNNYGVSLDGSYSWIDFSDKYSIMGVPISTLEYNSTLKQAAINAFFEHAMYPNTRTTVSFALHSETGVQELENESSFFGRVDLTGVASYFISYRTRFNFSFGAGYQKNFYITNQYLELLPDRIQVYANAGIEIAL